MHIRFFIFIIFCGLSLEARSQSEEFYGPFSSWTNLKEAYHAYGDGIHDDTKAIQNALNELGDNQHSPVLFIPKGTYIIRATLRMKSRIGIAIIGEDPLRTIIKWGGAENQKMVLLNGVSYSEYGRITWDGSNKASVAVAHEWDKKTGYANSGTQHSDEIFKNVATGIKSGMNMDAEFRIQRCRFYNCSSAGISLQGWNALDWWIWDCYFENCKTGAANNHPSFGAGNFHVYRSVFKHSKLADVSLGHSNYFSFRNNVSYNSNCFIKASQFSNTSPFTIQNNIIISETNSVIADMFTKGNSLFLDNTFITPDSNRNFVIRHVDNFQSSSADVTMIGNSFASKRKTLQTDKGRVIDAGNSYGIRLKKLPPLDPKPFAVLRRYRTVEISHKNTSAEIQKIINNASKRSEKTIIHFRHGTYSIDDAIVIPGGSSVIILGDGLQTILKWTGAGKSALLKLQSPALAIIKNVKMSCGNKSDGILLLDEDKSGNIVYANQLLAYGGDSTNILVNGFSNTEFRFESLHHNYCSKGTSLKVTGTSKNSSALVKVFGCVSVNNANSYQVNKKGRLLVYDAWFEDNINTRFLSGSNEGEFILNGAQVANTNTVRAPFIQLDSFNGKIVLAQVIANTPGKTIYFSDSSSRSTFLGIGILSWSDSTSDFYNIRAKKENYMLINNRYNIGKGSFPVPDSGDTSHAFLNRMLSTIRTTTVLPVKYKRNRSFVTLHRVMIENGINNLRIEKL